MEKYAVIVAGGSGARMNNPVPKQFLELQGKPVLMHTLERFYKADPTIRFIVVLPPSAFDVWKELCIRHQFTIKHSLAGGGETRFHSVKNGLAMIQDEGLVAVHDGVRPLVSAAFINRLFKEAAVFKNVVPVVPVAYSLREIIGISNRPVDRTQFRIVQTPQLFRISEMKKAFEQPYRESFTDEATVMEQSGAAIHLTEGEDTNIKITTPADLLFAETILASW